MAIAILVVLMVGASVWYVNDYYHADNTALSYVDGSKTNDVTVRTLSKGELAFVPQKPVAGLVFYPGERLSPSRTLRLWSNARSSESFAL